VAIRTVNEHKTGITQSGGLNYLAIIILALKSQHSLQNNFHLKHPVALHKLQNTSLLMPSAQLVVLCYSTQICDYICGNKMKKKKKR
jgi:hypothetical protein